MSEPSPGRQGPDLTLVVPCYNEAGHLRESVATVLEVLDGTRLDYELVFVDDCSQDDTRKLLAELCAAEPRCRTLLHPANRGRGAAFKTGFAASQGRVTGFLDIDLEVHPLYIPRLVALLERHGYDVATGHRHYLLRQTHALHRHLLSGVYRWLCRFLLGMGVRDSETGCKFFRRETSAAVVLGSESDGWFWDTEVMARAALANLRIVELPVLFLRRADKRSTVRLWHDIRAYLVALHRFRARVGLSLLNKSPIYWSGLGYDLAMRALYRSGYRELYAAIARLIPAGASVVDVCAGTGVLYREHLRDKLGDYLALDFNGHFVMAARRRGVPARFFDLHAGAVPEADYVVMASSLYHFHPREDEVLERLRRSARKAVIVSEPVENLSRRFGPLGRLLARLTDPGVGDPSYRFDPESFAALAERHGARLQPARRGERNAIAVLPGGAG